MGFTKYSCLPGVFFHNISTSGIASDDIFSMTLHSLPACRLAYTVETRYNLAMNVEHLKLPVYPHPGERIVGRRGSPSSLEWRVLNLKPGVLPPKVRIHTGLHEEVVPGHRLS